MREGPLTWTTHAGERDGTLILCLFGPWTLENSAVFQQEFLSLRPAVLILDMSGVPYIDSAGVGMLMQAHVSAHNGGRAFLLAGVTDHVMALFYLIRVHAVLTMLPTVAKAEAAAWKHRR